MRFSIERNLGVLLLSVSFFMLSGCSKPKTTIIAYSSSKAISAEYNGVRIYSGGPILTLEMDEPLIDAVAIQNDKIIDTGNAEHLSQLYKGAQQIDLQGNTLMPGLIESHTHLMLMAATYDYTPLGPLVFDSLAEMKVAFKAIKPNQQGHILGIGWEVGGLELSITQMDEIFPDNPVFVAQRGHGIWANTKGFELRGINKNSVAPEGSEYVKDKNGELTGYVSGHSATMLMFGGGFPLATVENTLAAANDTAALGYATFADIGVTSPATVDVLLEAMKEQAFPLKVIIALADSYDNVFSALKKIDEKANDKLTFIGVKSWIDGAVQGGNVDTSLHYHSENFEKTKGPWHSQEHFNTIALNTLKAGKGYVFHANGDLALKTGLNAVEYALNEAKKQQLNTSKFFAQAIHVSLSTDADFDKMKALGVKPTFLLGHHYYNGDRYVDELFGDAVKPFAFKIKTAFDKGLITSIHNDFPTTPTTPFLMMETSVTRVTKNGNVLVIDEAITIEQALQAYTINAAIQYGIEQDTGSIKTGKAADLVIINGNPLTMPIEQVSEIKVLATLMNGQVTYLANSL